MKERLHKLQEAMLHVTDSQQSNIQKSTQVESPINTAFDTTISPCAQLLESGLVVEAHHLKNADKGAKFECVQNHDSNDFMNNKNSKR